MPSLADISDAGGWAVFAFSVFAIGIGLVRGWWVPGWIYQSEREQRVKAEIQAERNAESLALLAKAATDGRRGHDPA